MGNDSSGGRMRILVVFTPDPHDFWSTDTVIVECENRDDLTDEVLINLIGQFREDMNEAKSVVSNKYYFLVNLRETDYSVENGKVIYLG